jgi:Uma2 family endonuclease
MATSLTPLPREMTVEEWADLDDDVDGELVDGQLVEEEVVDFGHEGVVAYLLATIRPWARARGGQIFGSEAKLAISARRGRRPDLSVYLPRGGVPNAKDRLARVPPAIAIEVVTGERARDRRRDRVEKVHDYASIGVASYWLVDPAGRTLEVLTLDADGRYVIALSESAGAHAIPGSDALSIDLDAMWREAGLEAALDVEAERDSEPPAKK